MPETIEASQEKANKNSPNAVENNEVEVTSLAKVLWIKPIPTKISPIDKRIRIIPLWEKGKGLSFWLWSTESVSGEWEDFVTSNTSGITVKWENISGSFGPTAITRENGKWNIEQDSEILGATVVIKF